MTKKFWEGKWSANHTGWDLNQVSPPIKNYIDQLTDKNIRILIPGCGNAYEAEYLMLNGFKNVFVIDVAKQAIESFRSRCPDFPKENLINGDFFNHVGKYDLIVEQTFFCAIDPEYRKPYVKQMLNLLKPNGRLVGLLFDMEFDGGPPFGGNVTEYKGLFKSGFVIETLSPCYNSITPRQGSEIFINLRINEK